MRVSLKLAIAMADKKYRGEPLPYLGFVSGAFPAGAGIPTPERRRALCPIVRIFHNEARRDTWNEPGSSNITGGGRARGHRKGPGNHT